jgi:hypothetical protein
MIDIDGGDEDERGLSDAEIRELAQARELNYADRQEEPEPVVRGQVEEPEEDEEPAPRVPVGSERDDLAEEIAERNERRQSEQSREFDEDLSKMRNQIGAFADDDEGTEAPPDDEAPPSGGDQPAPRLAEDDMLVEVTVRGEKRLVPLGELKASAQKMEAADSYLADSRRIFDEARALREQIAQGKVVQPETPEQRAAAERGLTDEQKEARRSLINALTYGTEDEGAAALERFQQETEERAIQRLEARQQMKERRDIFLNRMNVAQQYISENMPDIAGNPAMLKVFGVNLTEGQKFLLAKFVENLPDHERARMARHNLTPDRIRSLTSPRKIMEVYADFAVKGYPVPNIDEVMVRAGQITRDEAGFTNRNPAQPGRGTTPADGQGRGNVRLSSDRMARKESLTPQPTRAGVGQGPSSQAEQRRGVSESDFHREAMAERMEQGYTLPRRR